VADLWSRFAEAESDAASWERQCETARDDALKYGNESTDLRRKLEEANARADGSCDAAVEIRHRLADASLLNVALWEALERFRRTRGVHKGPHNERTIQVCAACDEAYVKAEAELDAALDLLADGLARTGGTK
jgi:hypothetical protein